MESKAEGTVGATSADSRGATRGDRTVVLRPLDPLLAAAVGQSFLARLPADLTTQVLDGGYRIDFSAGVRPDPSGDSTPVALVLDGLIRVFLVSEAGRQVTVRYARPGETLGLVHLFGRETGVRTQAITPTSIWLFRSRHLRTLAERHAELATAIAEECAARASDAIEELALDTFGSIRQRIARHLLDLAAVQQDAGDLVAAVTQQELADAAGTVREVVARVLKQLHRTGATAASDGGVVILDAARLDAEATRRGADAT